MRKITVAKGDGIFENQNEGDLPKSAIPKLMSKAIEEEVDVIKTENLYEFDGERGYSLGQGQ